MNLLAVAGELSGDAHGGPLLRELSARIPGLSVEGIGGPQMLEEGLSPLFPLESLQVHGLVEVVRHLPRLYRILWALEARMDAAPPDAVLLIDYPGFNLRVARAAKARGIPVCWYSSPQVWAWRRRRLLVISQVVDKIVVLFPFEVPLYTRIGVDAEFAGHPLVGQEATEEEVQTLRSSLDLEPGLPVVGVMPGSRPSELARNLPPLLEAIGLIGESGYRANYVLPLAPTLERRNADAMIDAARAPVRIAPGGFLPLLKLADLAMVASGTATLQVGLAGVPFLVVYRVSPLTYWFAKRVAYVQHIAMVNILAEREVVPELVQGDFTPERVRDTFLAIARDEARQAQMRRELKALATSLGQPGAYERGAVAIAEFLRERATRAMEG